MRGYRDEDASSDEAGNQPAEAGITDQKGLCEKSCLS